MNPIDRPAIARSELLAFLRDHRHAVEATVAGDGRAQASVVGIAVSDAFDLVFDTLRSTRKAQNLELNPNVAFVIGGLLDGEERTVQYEGIVDRPDGDELAALQRLYYGTFPDGPARLEWPGLIYLRARPRWIRYSDYRTDPPVIVELTAGELETLR